MNPQFDSAGNAYYEVGDVRITAVPHIWCNGPSGVRIQAYRKKGRALHRGPEYATPDLTSARQLAAAIALALAQHGH